jgi:transcriptional regulator with XRE-family HTH domain
MDLETANGINARIARQVRTLRNARQLTLDSLASKAGVSKSMISLIERGEASPTAVILEKLAGGLGTPLANLFAGESLESGPQPVIRRSAQLEWRDPASGYLRRTLSPPGWPSPIQLVEIEFPSGSRVAYETGGRDVSTQQQIWVLQGRINVRLGNESHELAKGDCMAMVLDKPIVYSNETSSPARYVVAIANT